MTGDKLTIKSLLNLVRGKARFFFKPREGGTNATVKTKTAVMGVRGTLFIVDSQVPTSTKVVVLSGKVTASNVHEPEKEVIIKPNERAEIAANSAPTEPVAASPEVIAQATNFAKIVPNKTADGVAPADLELPPPEAPAPEDEEFQENGTLNQDPLEELGSKFSPKPFRPIVCTEGALNDLRRRAQDIDVSTPRTVQVLANCPGFQSEVLYWGAFYHFAQGELGQVISVGKYLKPHEGASERDNILAKANKGDATDLLQLIEKNKPGYARDAEALLTAARVEVRSGQFAKARELYTTYLKLPMLRADKSDISVEAAYIDLWEGKYEDAEKNFTHALDEDLSSSAYASAKRGLALAKSHTDKSWSAAAGKQFVGLGIGSRTQTGDFQVNSLSIAAQTRYLTANAQALFSKTKDKDNVTREGKGTLVTLSHSFSFPYHMNLDAELGLYGGQKGSILFGGLLSIDYDNGWRPFLGINAKPYIVEQQVRYDAVDTMRSELKVGIGWEDYFMFSLSRKNLLENASTASSFTGHIPLIGNMPENDFFKLRLFLDTLAFQKHVAAYYSPTSRVDLGAGLETQFVLTTWATLNADADVGYVSQKTGILVAENDSFEPTANIYKDKTGTLLRVELGFQFPFSATLHGNTKYGVEVLEGSTQGTLSKQQHIDLGIRYLL